MLHFPFDSEERAKHAEAAIEKLEYAIGQPSLILRSRTGVLFP
jgi:hypothetical protein